MKANLHLHSRYSDGSIWPEEIAREAAEQGLFLVALTDHDSMGGAIRFRSECARLGIEAIIACEIDVSEPEIDYKSEILAYFPLARSPGDCPTTSALLARVLDDRRERLEYYLYWARTIFRRKDLGFSEILADRLAAEPYALGGSADSAPSAPSEPCDVEMLSWSKVDLFLFLKGRGVIDSTITYKRFKREWFGPGRFPKYRMSKPSVADCVQAIHADSGFAVIPHFGHLWNDDPQAMGVQAELVRSKLEHFRARGVDGLEMYWYSGRRKTEEINRIAAEAAQPLGYFLTYGSDCHGPGTDKYTLDKFSGEFLGFPGKKREKTHDTEH
ncbi:MAG TPA: PHP domain-containing protein [Rectinemataceae bacterium]